MKKTQKRDLLGRFSLKEIKQKWVEYGMYRAGEILECNPWVVYHLAREHKWRRPLPSFLEKAYREGSWRLTERYFIEGRCENE